MEVGNVLQHQECRPPQAKTDLYHRPGQAVVAIASEQDIVAVAAK